MQIRKPLDVPIERSGGVRTPIARIHRVVLSGSQSTGLVTLGLCTPVLAAAGSEYGSTMDLNNSGGLVVSQTVQPVDSSNNQQRVAAQSFLRIGARDTTSAQAFTLISIKGGTGVVANAHLLN
jgi:hypothetical protein